MTTLISTYGGDDEKGTIMGIFRSLGAMARAVGPVLASTGKYLLRDSQNCQIHIGLCSLVNEDLKGYCQILIFLFICSNL